jgi:hypothetical protein
LSKRSDVVDGVADGTEKDVSLGDGVEGLGVCCGFVGLAVEDLRLSKFAIEQPLHLLR